MKTFRKAMCFVLLFAAVLTLVGCAGNKNDEPQVITDISQLAGCGIGVVTGSAFDTMTDEYIENADKQYYESYADLAVALSKGKISGFLVDEPVGRMLCNEQKGLRFLDEYISRESYAFAFPKTDEGGALRDRFNEFLSQITADGTLDEFKAKWLSDDENAKAVTYPPENGSAGTLRFATDSRTAPFSYVKDGQVVGYDIDILCRFCEKYGYGLEISDTDFAAIIPALVTGKADLVACCITVTEERADSVYFSNANYEGGVVVMVADASAAAENIGFFESLMDSFYKNFVKENRWKMLLSGLGITVLISVCSGLLGAALGFGVCMQRRCQNKIPRAIAAVYIRIMQGTPILVFLMILYYVIFGKSDISPIIVAIIGFAVNFSAYVSEMMRTGIESVDKGQNEAALALGYTKRQSFFKVVFPQAAKHFLPVIKGEFVSLVKMTSIVGYITIQDLTKASDIIRSRTYEAFFPLIVTAIIYFVISWLLTIVLGRIEIRLDPKKRSKKRKSRAKEANL